MRALNWRFLVDLFQPLNRISRHRRRHRPRLVASAEVLEYRLCLSAAPVISNLSLQNDTGQAGDNITEDPTLTGTLADDGGSSMVDIEIDFDGDSLADDCIYAQALGTFEYDPSSLISFGQVTINVRAIEMDPETTEITFGEWVPITFDYKAPPNDPPSITGLSLLNDTGDPGDNITLDPTLTGTLSDDGGSSMMDLEVDFDGDGLADDCIYAPALGTFEYDPSSHISFGQVTIAVRAVEMDPMTTETAFGEWVSITFDYQAPPNDPPAIASFSLANDTGVAGDLVTDDPTLMGSILNDGPFENIEIDIDYDGDGVADDFLYVGSDGTFEFDPTAYISAGEVTIAVRAFEMDPVTTEYHYSEWTLITFTLEEE
jgi:hypothetical protein